MSMTSSASVVRSLPTPTLGSLAVPGARMARRAPPEGGAAETSIAQLLAPFFWHRWIVIGCIVVGIVIAAVVAMTSERQYAATAKLLVGSEAGGSPRVSEARVGFEEQI